MYIELSDGIVIVICITVAVVAFIKQFFRR
jgi:hypothetical protein